MDQTYINWDNNNTIWEEEDSLWNAVYDIITQDIYGGARNPLEDEELKRRIDQLDNKKVEKLIKVIVNVKDKLNEQKAIKKSTGKITVQDIQWISKNYLKIEIL